MVPLIPTVVTPPLPLGSSVMVVVTGVVSGTRFSNCSVPATEILVMALVIASWPPTYRSFGASMDTVPVAEPASMMTWVPPVRVTVIPPWPVTGRLLSSLTRVTV
ncbi:hypothetical protein D3C76_1272060 [compost metagenome]